MKQITDHKMSILQIWLRFLYRKFY